MEVRMPKPIAMLQDERLLAVDKMVREYGQRDYDDFPKEFVDRKDWQEEYGRWCKDKFSKGYIDAFNDFVFKFDEIREVAKRQMQIEGLKNYIQLWDTIMRNHQTDTYLF